RLLEQVLPERGVRLLAVPGTAVGLSEPVADEGHRPWSRDGRLRRDRRNVERAAKVGRLERADGRRSPLAAEPGHGRVGRVEPAQDGDCVTAPRTVPARERSDRTLPKGIWVGTRPSQPRERDDEE